MRAACPIAMSGFMTLAAMASAISASHEIEVLRWQAPRTGWLYVIDATAGESRIFLFDPEHGKVAGSIRTGYNPDIAVSPRGDRPDRALTHRQVLSAIGAAPFLLNDTSTASLKPLGVCGAARYGF